MPSLPWVRFYGAKWLSSKTRLLMTTSQRSIYLDLLYYIYEYGGSIPKDPQQLAVLAAVSLEEFNAAWPVVGKNFCPCPDDPNMLSNRVMLEVIRETEEKSRSGRIGGRARAGASKQVLGRTEESRTEQRKEEEETHTRASLCDAPLSDSPFSHSKRSNPSSEVTEPQRVWFELFWAAFWVRKSRARALAAFARAVTTEEQFTVVMAAVKAQSAEMLAREPQRRVWAEAWLDGERWRDEPDTPTETPRPW